MNKAYDTAVFIGRFSPFHNGHLDVVLQAAEKAKHIKILVGSADCSPNPRNPFSFEERAHLISLTLNRFKISYEIIPVPDILYNDEAWITYIQKAVGNSGKTFLTGHLKDHSSYYLNLFPEWEFIPVNTTIPLNATDIRKILFQNDTHDGLYRLLDREAVEWLLCWRKTIKGKIILQEVCFIEEYKQQWKDTPYPVTFVTVDSVVVQSGHVLLVERKHAPGKGLNALPGGFLNQHETLLQAAIRELREETKLKVPEPVLLGSMKKHFTFDNPHRSQRGRTITSAFLFHLSPNHELPKVKGSDDAAKAFWIPLSELDPRTMFEDHFSIIHKLIGDL